MSSSAFAEMPRVTNVATRSRWLRASTRVACAERTSPVVLGFHLVVLARDGQTQSGARLLECRLRLLAAQLEIRRRQAGDDLTAPDRGAEIDEEILDAAGDLEAEHHLFLGGEGAADGDGVDDRHALGARDRHLRRGAPVNALRRSALAAAAARGSCCTQDEHKRRTSVHDRSSYVADRHAGMTVLVP